jgi:ABC-type molybdate transport system ATPase subunit
VWTALAKMTDTAIVVGTDSLEECSVLSTRMLVLAEGRVEAIGPVEALLKRYRRAPACPTPTATVDTARLPLSLEAPFAWPCSPGGPDLSCG